MFGIQARIRILERKGITNQDEILEEVKKFQVEMDDTIKFGVLKCQRFQMSYYEKKIKKVDWPIIIFIAALLAAFTYGGVLIGIIVLLIGLPILGWKNRHKGPFPTNKK